MVRTYSHFKIPESLLRKKKRNSDVYVPGTTAKQIMDLLEPLCNKKNIKEVSNKFADLLDLGPAAGYLYVNKIIRHGEFFTHGRFLEKQVLKLAKFYEALDLDEDHNIIELTQKHLPGFAYPIESKESFQPIIDLEGEVIRVLREDYGKHEYFNQRALTIKEEYERITNHLAYTRLNEPYKKQNYFNHLNHRMQLLETSLQKATDFHLSDKDSLDRATLQGYEKVLKILDG